MAVKTYDPKGVSLIVGGHIVQGYADGSFVKVSRNEDMFSTKIGADGEPSRTKSNNKSGLLEITLLQSSASNDVLSGYALADELSNSGQVPVMVKDNNGTSIYVSEAGWIKKMPDAELGKELGERTWIIECGALDMFVGGNA